MHAILEFLWPIMAVSGEAMLAFWFFIILIIIGRGKILPSEKHIVIVRAGQYKIDLEQGLNLAQPFIEAIAKEIELSQGLSQVDADCMLMVKDKNIATRKQPFYLLSISLKNGFIEFAAKQVTAEFLKTQPSPFTSDNIKMGNEGIEAAAYAAAKPRAIELRIAANQTSL